MLGLIVEKKNGFLFQEANINGLKLILKNIFINKYHIVKSWENRSLKNFSLEKMVENHLALVLNNKS